MSKKINLIIHPVRMRLVTELGNRQLTTAELAIALPDIPQASLYRHIKRLHEGGIFQIAAETMVNGSIERTWELGPNQSRLTKEEIASLTAEEHQQYFSVFAAGLIDSFGRYVNSSPTLDFEKDGMSYNQAVIYLSDKERAELQETFIKLVQQGMHNLPTPERKKYTLTSVVIPDNREDL